MSLTDENEKPTDTINIGEPHKEQNQNNND